ncbi:MAG: thioredoxin [Chitinophagaceae bacterium]|nr:thioredoxin [Chitinophagaceae bacterium]
METFNEIINGDTPVLVDFHATWCGPCKQMAPELAKFARANSGKLRVIKVDVDRNRQASANYQIQGVPTLILFKNGKVLWRQSGAMSASQLDRFVQPFL